MANEGESLQGSQADKVYKHLRSLILELELRPGERLAENPLAKTLGVSRTPIRQALQSLEREGLVTHAPGGGLTVSGLTVRDVNEICDLLQMLDTYIFQRAAGRISTADAQRLEQRAAEMLEAARSKDISAWSRADKEFHSILGEAADNARASEYAVQLRSRLQRIWIGIVSRQSRLEECSVEHADIARVVRDSDLNAISELVDTHIGHMRQSLLRMLEDAAPLLGTGSATTRGWEDV